LVDQSHRPLSGGFQEGENALLEQRRCILIEVGEAACAW
jgi:hypothetical protein